MSDISIRRSHQLNHKQAVEVVNQVAKELTDEYGITATWDGDSVHVKGSGLTGQLHLAPKMLEIDVKLGFMLSIFEQKIHDGIEAKLDKLLSAKAKKSK